MILKDFKENIDRPLAAILTLNTISHTVGAIGVGSEAMKIWSNSNPIITSLIVPIIMTAAILILSEIIPKTIGATNWRMFAPFTIYSLNLLLKIISPIIWFCQKLTSLFNSKKEKNIFSRADFLAMAQIGSKEGLLEKSEEEFIYNLLHFKHYKARDVMTPRTVIVSAPQNMTVKEFYNSQEEKLVFSRIPIYEEGNGEAITGYILKDDILEHLIDEEKNKPLSRFKHKIMTILDTKDLLQSFNDFIKEKEHIALVLDNYGVIAGIVTMEDIIETLLGAEIVDETDKIVDLQAMARKQSKNHYKNSL